MNQLKVGTRMGVAIKSKPCAKIGWFLLFLGLPLGNTSAGALFLLGEEGYRAVKYKQRSFGLYFAPIYKYLGLLIGVMVVSSLASERRGLALLSTFGFFLLVSMVVLGATELTNSSRLSIFLAMLVISSMLSAGYVFFQYFIRHVPRASAPFVGVTGYGTLAIISTSMGIGYLWALPGKWKYLAIPYLTIMALAIGLTLTRGAWLGYVAMLLILGIRNKRHLMLLLLIVAILGALVFTLPVTRDRIQDLGRAFELRNDIWTATLAMIKEHPLLGVGPGIYAYAYPKYRLPNTSSPNAVYAHNIFLQVLAEMGFLGFITFFGFLFMVLWAAYYLARRNNFLYQALFAGLVGVLVAQQFDNTIVGFEVGGGFWLLVGLTLGLYFQEKQTEAEKATKNEAGEFN